MGMGTKTLGISVRTEFGTVRIIGASYREYGPPSVWIWTYVFRPIRCNLLFRYAWDAQGIGRINGVENGSGFTKSHLQCVGRAIEQRLLEHPGELKAMLREDLDLMLKMHRVTVMGTSVDDADKYVASALYWMTTYGESGLHGRTLADFRAMSQSLERFRARIDGFLGAPAAHAA